jgi:hypothetical protein
MFYNPRPSTKPADSPRIQHLKRQFNGPAAHRHDFWLALSRSSMIRFQVLRASNFDGRAVNMSADKQV